MKEMIYSQELKVTLEEKNSGKKEKYFRKVERQIFQKMDLIQSKNKGQKPSSKWIENELNFEYHGSSKFNKKLASKLIISKVCF